ncbi:zinc ribbon domain-containing protein [candidate division WOR-3 bacterium]|uniref:Zinc ribbon domain-containing protein n=1 Tax=candidate division WOR-3 bacterium TaxID=2052148 RepID=A0A660SEX2_UNCW3|nr:MAG: zinc ribbon domain-containing protein [candidate division WOR-3 bacterium]
MPIYEFRCSRCTKRFECLVLSPSEPIRCPECGSDKVEKLFSTFGLKGDKSTPSCISCSANSCKGCK